MKRKTLSLLLITTSLLGYLEWGGNNHSFLFQIEAEILSKILVNPISVLHPLTILPMIGQCLLIVTLFQKKPSNLLTYIGIVGLGILLVFIFIIGVMNLNFKMIFSTIPFIILTAITVRHIRIQHKK